MEEAPNEFNGPIILIEERLRHLNEFLQNEQELRTKGIKNFLKQAQLEYDTLPPLPNTKNVSELIKNIEKRITELRAEEARLERFLADMEKVKESVVASKSGTTSGGTMVSGRESPSPINEEPATERARLGLGIRQRKTPSNLTTTSITTANDPRDKQHQRYRREHEEITADMIQMARRLKQNNLALQSLVQADKKIVKEAGSLLHDNTGKFTSQHQELTKFSSKSWATTWKLLLLGLMVVGSIIIVFMLILVSSKR